MTTENRQMETAVTTDRVSKWHYHHAACYQRLVNHW